MILCRKCCIDFDRCDCEQITYNYMSTKTHLIYLAGAISGCTVKECTDWRKYVMREMPDNILTISPMRCKEFLEKHLNGGAIDDHYDINPLSTSKGINVRDYNDVRRADAVFVNLIGAKKVSIGTVMEIAWCRAFNKPVVLCMEPGNIHEHCMLEYACGYIVPTVEEGIEVMKSILLTDKELM